MTFLPRMVVGVSIAATSLLAMPAALAADSDQLRSQLFNDPSIDKEMIMGAKASGVMREHPCPTMQYKRRTSVTIYDEFDFDDAGYLTKGSWKEAIDATGCGVTRVLNVFARLKGPRSFDFRTIFPGDTHAGPQLQSDSLDYVIDQVQKFGGAAERGCDLHYIANTQFIALDGPTAPGTGRPPWHEVWTVETCKKSYRVPIRFTPVPDGTDFAVSGITVGPRPK